MMRRLVPFAVVAFLACAAPAKAQSLGTFRWQLQPFGSILSLSVTQQGSIYLMNGVEIQCSNPSLPVWGVAVPQANGTIIIGLTTITEQGNGLHTRATLPAGSFDGGWMDNANSSGTLLFNPPNPCPSGPRVGPIEPDPTVAGFPTGPANSSMLQTLMAEVESMRKRLSELEAKKQ